MLDLGVQSFQALGQEFLASVFGTGPTGQTSLVCGAGAETGASGLQTSFHLDPYLEDECAGTDWVVLFILGLLIHAISWWSRWLLWEPLANWRMRGHNSWDKSECERLSTAATSLLFFASSAFFGGRILLQKDWLLTPEGWALGGMVIDADFKFYYLMYAARFFSDLVSIFFEDRKTDAFIASFIHHLVTLGLVLGSAHVGNIHYGGIIMFFFDWADIPLLSAKVFKYLSKDPKDAFQFVANRLFETFAVLFFLTRNLYYNYVVYWACKDPGVKLFNKYLLVALVGLQTYWLYLVIMAVIRQKKNGGNAEDVREKKAN